MWDGTLTKRHFLFLTTEEQTDCCIYRNGNIQYATVIAFAMGVFILVPYTAEKNGNADKSYICKRHRSETWTKKS